MTAVSLSTGINGLPRLDQIRESERREYLEEARMRAIARWIKSVTPGGVMGSQMPTDPRILQFKVTILTIQSERLDLILKTSRDNDDHSFEALTREVTALKQLKPYPYFSRLFSHTVIDSRVVQLLSSHGGTIDVADAENIPSLKEILSMGMQLYLAAGILMKYRIIHGNLKPGNIVLCNGVVQIKNFTYATRLEDRVRFIPTTLWRNPKTLFLPKECEHEIDHWAIACTLLSIISRGDPFQIDGEEAPTEKVPFIQRLIAIGCTIPKEWQKSDFYQEHRKEFEGTKQLINLKDYMSQVVQEELPKSVQQYFNASQELTTFLTEAFTLGSKMGPDRAILMPIFRSFFIYVEIIRDPDCGEVLFVLKHEDDDEEPMDEEPMIDIDLSKTPRWHQMIDRKDKYIISIFDSKSKELISYYEEPISIRTRIFVRKDGGIKMVRVFDDWKESEKAGPEGKERS